MRHSSQFTWRDSERTIWFGPKAVDEAPARLDELDWDTFELLTTERALETGPKELEAGATNTHLVRPGAVNEISAELLSDVTAEKIVAFGGGRVLDTAKAIAAVTGARVAAVPTTMSGAELTKIHKMPDGHKGYGVVRPELVFADPDLMTAQPEPERRASAMNALAHAVDCLYTPLANPVSLMSALEGSRLIANGLDEDDRHDLALGALLAAYAIDSARFGLHHVICQTLVRVMRIPHAETNAAILPYAVEALASRAPDEIGALAESLGTDTNGLTERIGELSGGRRSLGEIGADADKLDEAIEAMIARDELENTPDPPGRNELVQIVENAW